MEWFPEFMWEKEKAIKNRFTETLYRDACAHMYIHVHTYIYIYSYIYIYIYKMYIILFLIYIKNGINVPGNACKKKLIRNTSFKRNKEGEIFTVIIFS